jgi:iron uptake system component EfeO
MVGGPWGRRKRWLGLLLLVFALLAVGCGSGGDADQATGAEGGEEAALARYRSYVEENASSLVEWTHKLWGQTVAERLPQAQSRYATSRVQYGQLLPVPQLFPALDRRINGQRGEAEGGFGGFHRLELSLFRQERIAGLQGIAKRLVDDLRRLEAKVKTAPLDPEALVRSTEAMLEEVAGRKLAGGEARYSELDFVDVSADVEGAEAVFEAVRPLLRQTDPALVHRLEARFERMYQLLVEVGTPAREAQTRRLSGGSTFLQFGEAAPSTIRALKAGALRLAGSFREVSARLASDRPPG